VRRCGTCTVALAALADWLMDGGVPTVARASTGVSGRPWFARLAARGVQVVLSDPRHATRAPGRPTPDRLDGQWRPRLPASGRLAGAFRPDDQVWVLRGSVRPRQRLLTSAAHQMPPRHKALQPRPLTLPQVVSALPGVTGMASLKARVAGERDPQPLAQLRHSPCHHEADDSAKALQGPWRAAPLCALPHALALSAVSHQHLALCAQQLTGHRETCAEPSAGPPLPPKARRHTKTNAPRFEARTPLSRMAGVDLTTIEGLAAGTAFVILSAMGMDRHRWPRVQHVWSWLGRCPQHQIAGGKGWSRRGRPGAHRGTVALRLAARRFHPSQRALGACWRRRNARRGTPKAITATAHTRARLVSRLGPHGSASVHQGLDAYEAHSHARQVTTMAQQAKALGSPLVPLVAQGEDRGPGPLRSRPSSPSASHALRCHRSQGLRGRSVPSIPRQPPRQQGLSNGGHPFHDVPHPCHDTPHPPPERPHLAGEFLGRRERPPRHH